MKPESALAQIKLLAPELDAAGIRAGIDSLMMTGFARAARKQLRSNNGGRATRKTLLALADSYIENCAASFRSTAGEAVNKLVTSP